jgi:hypothetical protein
MYAKFHKKFKWADGKGYTAFQVIRTFWLTAFLRAFDIYPGVGGTLKQVGSIFVHPQFGKFFGEGLSGLGLDWKEWLVCVLGLGFLIVRSFCTTAQERKQTLLLANGVADKTSWIKSKPAVAVLASVAVLVILVFGVYGLGFNAQQFIYNRF